MDLYVIMSELAAAAATITGLRTYAYPTDTVQAPAAIVSYPDAINFDQTLQRGSDQIMIPVYVMVGKVSDRSSHIQLSAYCAGSGASSIKAVLEGYSSYTAADYVVVKNVTFDIATINQIDYMSAMFMCDIVGPGT